MATDNKTIVFFHIGRGGRFYNGGFKSYIGNHDLSYVIARNDEGKNHTFINKEDYYTWVTKLKKRDLTNLLDLLQNDESAFEKRTGIDLGEKWYFDGNGNQVISVEEVEGGVGTLNWDNDYDTDICKYLADCDKEELLLINEDYGGRKLIQQYFNECSDLKVDWLRFNENYEGLIEEYFDFYVTIADITEYYNEEL